MTVPWCFVARVAPPTALGSGVGLLGESLGVIEVSVPWMIGAAVVATALVLGAWQHPTGWCPCLRPQPLDGPTHDSTTAGRRAHILLPLTDAATRLAIAAVSGLPLSLWLTRTGDAALTACVTGGIALLVCGVDLVIEARHARRWCPLCHGHHDTTHRTLALH